MKRSIKFMLNINTHKLRVPRITKARRALVDTIKCQTGVSLGQDASKLFTIFDSWTKCEGIRSSTLRLKSIYLITLCLLLNQPNPCIPFVRTTEGFPTVILFLKKYQNTPQGKQAILSLLAWYRGVRAPGKPDFTSITDERKVEISSELIQRISSNIKRNETFNVSNLSPPKIQLRSKGGPNGQATLTCLQDLSSLEEHMKESIQYIAEAQGGEDFIDSFLEFDDIVQESESWKPHLIHSKLAIKQELGGKDRVFAIVDYWTQSTLEPLHSQLASILRTIDNDCTFDQGKGVEEIKSWTKSSSEIYSFDLKSATDRFPLILQAKVLEKLTGENEYSSHWANLIANRQFKYRKVFYKWSVGQPLGAYSSWPIFAYSHHLVVREAAKMAGVKDPQYYLLGDDIVINGKAVAEKYQILIEQLGLDISLTKSIFGSHAEFAKRIFSEGLEISPTPVKLLLALQRDPLLIKEACQELYQRSSDKETFEKLRYISMKSFAATTRSKEMARRVLIVGSSLGPEGIPPILHGVRSPWPLSKRENVETVYSSIKYKYLMSAFKKSADKISTYRDDIKRLEFPDISREAHSLHPIWMAIDRQQSFFGNAHRSIGKYWTSLKSKTYLPMNDLPSVESFDLKALTKSHKSRTLHQANIILLTHSAMVIAEQVFKERLQLEILSPNTLLKGISGEDRTSVLEGTPF